LTLRLGTIAAGAQAGIGNVAAGSLFALTQSAAMGGAVAGVVNGAVTGVGAVAVAYEALRGGRQDVGDGKVVRKEED
jgi:hypothetical protein